MKLKTFLTLTLLALLFAGCAKRSEIEDLQSQIDNLKSEKINSIEGQITAIQTSILNLQSTDKELQTYISALQKQASDLEKTDKELEAAIAKLKTELSGEISEVEANCLAQLDAYKTLVSSQLASIYASIETLQEKDKEIQKQIDALREYVNTGIKDAKDWASATFVTLEQYNATAEIVATIQGQISAINEEIAKFEYNYVPLSKEDLDKAISALDADLQSEIQKVVDDADAALSKAVSEIREAYTKAISEAVSSSETSMKSWISSQLTAYYTATETDAKITALKTSLEGQLEVQKTYLEGLISNLESSLNTKISNNASLIEGLQTQLGSLSSELSELAGKVAANSDAISANSSEIAKNALAISQNAEDITACETLIAANKELVQKNEAAINANAAAISALQSSVSDGEQTIATNTEAIAKNASDIASNASLIAANATAITSNAAAISSNTEEIQNLKENLANAKSEITAAYQAAITSAISTLEGKFNDSVAKEVAAINSRINKEVASINSTINALTARVANCESDVTSIKEQILAIQKEIQDIKDRINSVEGQITSILASIQTLQNTDSELRTYIEALQTQAAALEKTDKDLEAAIASLKTELGSDVSEVEANCLAQLEAYKTTVSTQLASINAAIGTLQEKDKELQKQIEDLQSYIDTGIKDAKDWASATFVTLEQYNATAEIVATIQGQISAINSQLEGLNSTSKEDLDKAISSLDATLQTKIQKVADDADAALTNAVAEITAAYTNAIAEAIAGSETSMKSWINSQLTAYYTAAETDAKIASLKTSLESQLATQKSYLEGLISNLETSLNTKIDNNKTLIDNLQSQLNSLSSEVSKLAGKVTANSSAISTNASEIAKNALAISQNSSDIDACESLIADNKKLIQQNETAIKANADAISSLQAKVTSNEQSIASNATAISKNASDIAANAALIAANATAITNNAAAIADNAAEIQKLRDELAKAKTDITAAYQTAITSAINTLEGKLNDKISQEIATINTRIDNEVAAINESITSLTARVATCENDIKSIKDKISAMQDKIDEIQEQLDELISRIQSIAVIPQYSDGAVGIHKGASEINIEISPSSVAQALVNQGLAPFSLQAVYTETKAVSFIDIPVMAALFSNGVVTLNVDGSALSDEFFAGTQTASARVAISSGKNDIKSGYFTLTPQDNLANSVTGAAIHITCRGAEISGKAILPSTTTDDLSFGVLYSTLPDVQMGSATLIEALSYDLEYNYSIHTDVLEPETTYYYRSYVSQGGEISYGDTKSFKTLATSSMIRTDEATAVKVKSVTLSATLDLTDCNYDSIECGFRIISEGEASYNVTVTNLLGKKFSVNIDDLRAGTTYSCEAYVILDGRVYKSNDVSFTTASFTASVSVSDATCNSADGAAITGVLSVNSIETLSQSAKIYYSDSETTLSGLKSSGAEKRLWPSTNGSFSVQLSGLGYSTTYYYVVVAQVEDTEFVSEVKSFTMVVYPEPVDLGLSVKWASFNLGASTPEEYGLYYQWGDVQGYDKWDDKYFYWYDDFGNVSYKWCNGSQTSMIKYNTKSSYGKVDNKTTLDLDDDAASVVLGGNWRMPTNEEWEELANTSNCSWTWAEIDGIKGYKVQSKKSGYTTKWIFLPANGAFSGDDLQSRGQTGSYWSSSLNTVSPYKAHDVSFDSFGNLNVDDNYRFWGQAIRPVSE